MSYSRLAALLVAPIAVFALGGMYHRGNLLTVEFPDGWGAPVTDKEGIITSNGPAGSNVLCNAQTNQPAKMKDVTLAQINTEFDKAFDAAGWGNILSVAPKDITVIASDRRPFGDAYYFVATLKLKAGSFAASDITTRFGAYILPGRMTMAGCYVLSEDYAKWSETFDKTVGSLRPW